MWGFLGICRLWALLQWFVRDPLKLGVFLQGGIVVLASLGCYSAGLVILLGWLGFSSTALGVGRLVLQETGGFGSDSGCSVLYCCIALFKYVGDTLYCCCSGMQ